MNKSKCAIIVAALTCGLTSQVTLAATDCSHQENWDDQTIYTSGDQVQHQGNSYTAKWWIQGTAPKMPAQYTAWDFVDSCNTPVTTNEITKETTPIVMETGFPSHALVGYWANSVTRATSGLGRRVCPGRLIDVANEFDVVMVRGASASSDGAITFAPADRYDPYAGFSATIRPYLPAYFAELYCDAVDPDLLKQDIAALQAKGKKVLMSVRGGNSLRTDQKASLFVDSVTQQINQWGFDGIELSGSGSTSHSPKLADALRSIHDNFNDEAFLTFTVLHNSSNISIVDEVRDITDLVVIKDILRGTTVVSSDLEPYYDLTDAQLKATIDLSLNTTEELVSRVRRYIDGFTSADGTFVSGLRPDQLAISISAGEKGRRAVRPSSSKSHNISSNLQCLHDGGTIRECGAFLYDIASVKVVNDAVNCITKGQDCNGADAGGTYPSFNGVVIENTEDDQRRNSRLAKPLDKTLESL